MLYGIFISIFNSMNTVYNKMINIYLRKITGKGERLQIEPSISSAELISEICKALKHSSLLQNQRNTQCYFRGSRLSVDKSESIADLGIVSNSIIHVVERQQMVQEIEAEERDIKVRLILENKPFEYEIANSTRVKELKESICKDLEITEQDLTLTHLGVELDSEKNIKDCGLSEGVLLSASVNGKINSEKFAQIFSASKESYSIESDGLPKVVRKDSSPLKKKIKKTESMNVEPSIQSKSKNINFCSVRLNKIQQKNDESRNQSQVNQSQISEQISQVEQDMSPPQWQKPKMTLDLMSKPWFGDQKVIQTESIVGDDESEEVFTECFLQLTRVDKKRQYVLQCGTNDTFDDAAKALAKLEKLDNFNIKLLLNFDQVSKSNISSKSSRGIHKSPRSSQSIKRQRSSYEGSRLLSPMQQGIKGNIIQLATKLRSKLISIEYQAYRQKKHTSHHIHSAF